MIKVEDGLLFPSCIIAYLLFSCLNDFFCFGMLAPLNDISRYLCIIFLCVNVHKCQFSHTYLSPLPILSVYIHLQFQLIQLILLHPTPSCDQSIEIEGDGGGGGPYEKNGWDSPKDGRINPFCTLCNMCFIFFYYGQ